METNKISLKQILEIKDAIKYLEDLIKSFKAGKVVVQQGDDYVDLLAPEMVDIKVTARTKKDKSKFSLELSWRNMAAETAEPVAITSKAPSPPIPKTQVATGSKTSASKRPSSPVAAADDEKKVYFGRGSGKKKATAPKPGTAVSAKSKSAAAKPAPKAASKADKTAAATPLATNK